jgi:hypothetical protein
MSINLFDQRFDNGRASRESAHSDCLPRKPKAANWDMPTLWMPHQRRT